MLRPDPKHGGSSASAPDPASASVARRLAGRTGRTRDEAPGRPIGRPARRRGHRARTMRERPALRATSDATADATPRPMILPENSPGLATIATRYLTLCTPSGDDDDDYEEQMIETHADPVFRDGDLRGAPPPPHTPRPVLDGRGRRRFTPTLSIRLGFQNLNVLGPVLGGGHVHPEQRVVVGVQHARLDLVHVAGHLSGGLSGNEVSKKRGVARGVERRRRLVGRERGKEHLGGSWRVSGARGRGTRRERTTAAMQLSSTLSAAISRVSPARTCRP